MHFQNLSQYFLHLIPGYDSINKSMLKKKFCSLKSFRQLLSDRLLDHTRTGKSDQSSRFCKNNISKHSKTCCDTSRSWISQYRNIKKACITVAFQCR